MHSRLLPLLLALTLVGLPACGSGSGNGEAKKDGKKKRKPKKKGEGKKEDGPEEAEPKRKKVTPDLLVALGSEDRDARSKAVLQRSLDNFTGTYIIVSHDRDFLAPLINKVVVLENGGLDLYHGTVDDYLEKYHADRDLSEEREKGKTALQSGKKQKRREAEKRQERHRRLKPLKDALSKIEEEIALVEEKKGEIEAAFSDRKTYEDEKKIKSLHIEHDKIASRLDSLYDEWTDIEGKIERIMEEDW